MVAFMCEYFPEYYQNFICTVLNACDASVMIFQSLYFKNNPDWLPLHVFGLYLSFVIIIAGLFIPESPKFLYAKKQFNKSRQVLM